MPVGSESTPEGAATAHGVLLTVAYDGAPFCGWATQAARPTVSFALRQAVASVDRSATAMRGASRTDARVHARGQLAAFDTELLIEPRGWVHLLNAALPSSIAVVRAASVPSGYDPRRRAQNKRYSYTLLLGRLRDPFWAGRAWRVGYRLNQETMASEAQALLGTHDFVAFRSAADDRAHTVRTIRRAEVRSARSDPRCLEVIVEGDGFLHNMVRIIVGTLVDVGRGRLRPGSFSRALASGNRGDLGVTAPAPGLCLERIAVVDEALAWWPAVPPAID
ncbi:MAG: tRNA pseudouridine(38-40) synthase TruA [Polyangiaceae bacterium]|nr:tRNA pseudouridine(38-40) synthase TruA [Polyangiaceae bacterium]